MKLLLLFVLFVYHTNPNAIIGSIVSYFFLFVVAFGDIDNASLSIELTALAVLH